MEKKGHQLLNALACLVIVALLYWIVWQWFSNRQGEYLSTDLSPHSIVVPISGDSE